MKYRREVTCQITAFEVPNPPLDPEATGRKWMAVATAHAYDPHVKVGGSNLRTWSQRERRCES